MMNLEDTLYEYIKSVNLTEDEEKYLSEYIQYIKKNTEFIYEILKETEGDKEKLNELVSAFNQIVKEN